MKKFFALTLALVCLISLCSCNGGEGDETSSNNDETIYVPTPVTNGDDTTVATDAPETTTAPDTTSIDTAAPIVAGTTSGEFKSETGTSLNLVCEWEKTVKENGEVTVKISVFLDTYTLFVGERFDGEIKVGDKTVNYKTDAIDYPGTTRQKYLFAEEEIVLSPEYANKDIEASASWWFGGTYAGLKIDRITATGVID